MRRKWDRKTRKTSRDEVEENNRVVMRGGEIGRKTIGLTDEKTRRQRQWQKQRDSETKKHKEEDTEAQWGTKKLKCTGEETESFGNAKKRNREGRTDMKCERYTEHIYINVGKD